MKYKLMFLDTETTGNLEEDRLTQVAYKWQGQTHCVNEMFKPPLPVKIEAMEITHITNRMLQDKVAFKGTATFLDLQKQFNDQLVVLIAHNAPFDVSMLEKEGLYAPNIIDTLRVARHLDVDAKLTAFRLQYLRYLLDLDADIEEPIQAHDARGDVLILEKLFDRLFVKIKTDEKSDDDVIAEMIEISRQPSLFRRFSFGKYTGELIEDVAKKDRGYLEWLYKQKQQSEADETDWLFTLQYFLK